MCQTVEITVRLDNNLRKAYKERREKYIPLSTNKQRVYEEYEYESIIITVEVMGAIPKTLDHNLKKLNFEQDQIRSITERLQRQHLLGR